MTFPAAVVRELGRRVSHRCSKPGCGVETIGPNSDPSKATVIGEAAHIRGEAPDAKRYDASMTDDQRNSIENGIWLCRNCHKEIDSDEVKYPVGRLQAWRIEAEAQAAERLGKADMQPSVAISIGALSIGQSGGQIAHTIINNAPPQRTLGNFEIPLPLLNRLRARRLDIVIVLPLVQDAESTAYAHEFRQLVQLIQWPTSEGLGSHVGITYHGSTVAICSTSKSGDDNDPMFVLYEFLRARGVHVAYCPDYHTNAIMIPPQKWP
jgi:hypothetical protein